MTIKFKRVELVDGPWLTGRLEQREYKRQVIGGQSIEPRTAIIFKADMRDIVELDADGIDEMISELAMIKEMLLEMDLEINPPEIPDKEIPVGPPIEESTPEPPAIETEPSPPVDMPE